MADGFIFRQRFMIDVFSAQDKNMILVVHDMSDSMITALEYKRYKCGYLC